MIDVAESNGHHIGCEKLAIELGVPVCPIVASEGTGIPELKQKLIYTLRQPLSGEVREFCELPVPLRKEVTALAELLGSGGRTTPMRTGSEALLLLGNDKALDYSSNHYPAAV